MLLQAINQVHNPLSTNLNILYPLQSNVLDYWRVFLTSCKDSCIMGIKNFRLLSWVNDSVPLPVTKRSNFYSGPLRTIDIGIESFGIFFCLPCNFPLYAILAISNSLLHHLLQAFVLRFILPTSTHLPLAPSPPLLPYKNKDIATQPFRLCNPLILSQRDITLYRIIYSPLNQFPHIFRVQHPHLLLPTNTQLSSHLFKSRSVPVM